MGQTNIDSLLECLLAGTDETSIDGNEIFNVCRSASEIMFNEPTLLQLYDNFHIIGDIHGHYQGLITIFQEIGYPGNDNNYIFLGDYVDRGPKSVETILLLLCYKVKYPKNIYLLRGNHECKPINSVYGFLNECQQKFDNEFAYEAFNRCFDYLPLAAIVYDRIFCCHAGIPKGIEKLSEIGTIQRPLIHLRMGPIVFDLLWSDPKTEVTGFVTNTDRKISHFFGPDALDEFLTKFNLSLVCRAHQYVPNGFEFFHNDKLITIFSAHEYHNNRMGIMSVTELPNHLECVCLSLPGYDHRSITIPIDKPMKELKKLIAEEPETLEFDLRARIQRLDKEIQTSL